MIIPTSLRLLEPMFLLLLPALGILLLFLLKKSFVRSNLNSMQKKSRRKYKIFLLVTRSLILLLLVLALANPMGQIITKSQGNPRVTILMDNSTSMQVLETNFATKLRTDLDERIPTEFKLIGSSTSSDIGTGILSNLEPDMNVLLITDGNPTTGPTIADVALYATSLNATISGIGLNTRYDETAVSIVGPDKVLSEVEHPYKIELSKTNPDTEILIKVELNGKLIEQERTTEPAIIIRKALAVGQHELKVTIETDDYFEVNNEYYKTITAVEKPKVLLVTQKDDPIKIVLEELYDVTATNTLPALLNEYYAIIINDMPAQNFRDLTTLTNYLNDIRTGGNGLIVIGGRNSYDKGNYKDSLLETILPVRVGTGTRKKGDANLAIVIDISGASGRTCLKTDATISGPDKCVEYSEGPTSLDVTKSLAVSVLDSLDPGNNVGAIAFASEAIRITNIAPLFENKFEVRDKISRLQGPKTGGGQSLFHEGIEGAYQLLSQTSGDKNILLFTDGNAYSGVQDTTLAAIQEAARQGIKTYVVGAGVRNNVDDEFLTRAAEVGNGIYFPATQANKLKILFGNPTDITTGEKFGLFVLNPNHFITKNLEIGATMGGFNQVIPKAEGQMLLTTTGGDPALTIGRFGLGRVGTITVFSGNNLGELLQRQNSAVITRTMNWAIGDPERKQKTYVRISDTTITEPTEVRVRSQDPIESELDFRNSGENLYIANLIPEEKGFNQVLGTTYAVNYEKEYQKVGMNPDYLSTVEVTGGQIFSPNDVEGIVEFVKSVSKRTQVENKSLAWYLVAAALIIYLIEVIIRRLGENKLGR